MMIDWAKDDYELACKGRFDQTWGIAKELKDEGEIVNFVSQTEKNMCSIVWNCKYYDCQEHFIDLLDDYTEWSKAHYNR